MPGCLLIPPGLNSVLLLYPSVLNDACTVDRVALNDLYFELSMLDKRQSSVNEVNNTEKKSKDLQTNI